MITPAMRPSARVNNNLTNAEVDHVEISSRLLCLSLNNDSFTFTQINGQRIYRKSSQAWPGPEPPKNCEIFIGRIPHDCFEDVLVPLFSQAGELFEFRLMINFSGWNRGYAFAMYATLEGAANAIRCFDNFLIRPTWQLGVCPSINNCRIYISKIPVDTSSEDIVRSIYSLTEEVAELRIRRSRIACSAIVEYNSHRGAAMARKVLVAASFGGTNGAHLGIDWSLPASAHLLRQYREVGRLTKDGRVELSRLSNSPSGSSTPTPRSYSLEPSLLARRMRLIQQAEHSTAESVARNLQHSTFESPPSSYRYNPRINYNENLQHSSFESSPRSSRYNPNINYNENLQHSSFESSSSSSRYNPNINYNENLQHSSFESSPNSSRYNLNINSNENLQYSPFESSSNSSHYNPNINSNETLQHSSLESSPNSSRYNPNFYLSVESSPTSSRYNPTIDNENMQRFSFESSSNTSRYNPIFDNNENSHRLSSESQPNSSNYNPIINNENLYNPWTSRNPLERAFKYM